MPVGVDDVVSPPDYPDHPARVFSPAEQARFEAELARLLAEDAALDVTIPRNGDPRTSPSLRRGEPLRGIRSSRRCDNPVGLVLEAAGARDLTVAACRVCPACRAWDRALDQYRLTEAAGDRLTMAVIPEARWSATRQRLARADSPYLSIPIGTDRRAVIVAAGAPLPGAPIENLADTLASLEKQRNRADRRRASSSGLAPRAEVEKAAFPLAEADPEAPRSVVGFFSARSVTNSTELLRVAVTVEAAANSLGVETTRAGLTVTVDGHRNGPRLDRLWTWLGVQWLSEAVPWYQGGPPPAVGSPGWETWSRARFGNGPTFEDPPLSAYPEAM